VRLPFPSIVLRPFQTDADPPDTPGSASHRQPPSMICGWGVMPVKAAVRAHNRPALVTVATQQPVIGGLKPPHYRPLWRREGRTPDCSTRPSVAFRVNPWGVIQMRKASSSSVRSHADVDSPAWRLAFSPGRVRRASRWLPACKLCPGGWRPRQSARCRPVVTTARRTGGARIPDRTSGI